jgi:hypothetical protein
LLAAEYVEQIQRRATSLDPDYGMQDNGSRLQLSKKALVAAQIRLDFCSVSWRCMGLDMWAG